MFCLGHDEIDHDLLDTDRATERIPRVLPFPTVELAS